jgi:hypothetical protein
MLWARILIMARCTTLCDKVCQWFTTGRWFSPVPPVSSYNKTDHHNITKILLKVPWSTTSQTSNPLKPDWPKTFKSMNVGDKCFGILQTRNVLMDLMKETILNQILSYIKKRYHFEHWALWLHLRLYISSNLLDIYQYEILRWIKTHLQQNSKYWIKTKNRRGNITQDEE